MAIVKPETDVQNNISTKEKTCENNEEIYNYDDAIDLTGNGCYNICLSLTLSLSIFAMCLNIFSFSVIIAMSSCDFQLTYVQKSILLSVPFTGPILTSYAWGYVSDTRGRKKTLLIGMFASLVMEILCAFSPNWIAMGIFKLISTCFCSCVQSVAFALMGESCPQRTKGAYLLSITVGAFQGLTIYMTLAYLIGHLDFSYDLGFIYFVPWRLLAITLALPIGMVAVSINFFYESPKFLLNLGREQEALVILRRIYRRNGHADFYPVRKVVLDESGNLKQREQSLLKSMWQQTAPLFKPPLLNYTLLTYYLSFVSYSVSGAFYTWLPFMAEAFTSKSTKNETQYLCDMIQMKATITTEPVHLDLYFTEWNACVWLLPSASPEVRVALCLAITKAVCSSTSPTTIELPMVLTSLGSAIFLTLSVILMSKLAHRRKASLIIIFTFSAMCCTITMFTGNIVAGVFYYGVFATSLCLGPIFAYYVDLYPTSFRGMASCLGVMVTRISSMLGVNLVGPFISSSCSITFYSLSAFLLSGAVISLLLPKDKRIHNK